MAAARYTFLLVVGLVAIGCINALPSSRIIGGEDAQTGVYPWVVSLRVNNVHTCGGAIISERHILTAAHCVSQVGTTPVDSEHVTVRVGSINQYAGGQIVHVDSIHVYEEYGNFLHDLAIIRLRNPLTFSSKLNKIAYANAEDEISPGTMVWVAGWGLQQGGAISYKLRHNKMNAISSEECELRAGYGYQSVLCMERPENEGVCRGDDGAGVVVDDKLVAVVSFFFGSCATKYPDIATKISYYSSWIDSMTV